MKKLAITLGFMILAAAPLAAGWCIASPSMCDLNASAQVPPGGSCYPYSGIFHARVVAYDSAGNIVGADAVYCGA